MALFWRVGVLATLLCLVGARIKPWPGTICFVPAAIWFLNLFLEIHSPEVNAPSATGKGHRLFHAILRSLRYQLVQIGCRLHLTSQILRLTPLQTHPTKENGTPQLVVFVGP